MMRQAVGNEDGKVLHRSNGSVSSMQSGSGNKVGEDDNMVNFTEWLFRSFVRSMDQTVHAKVTGYCTWPFKIREFMKPLLTWRNVGLCV